MSVIEPITMLGRGVPRNWIDNNRDFLIDGEEKCEDKVATLNVSYKGSEEDLFKAVSLDRHGHMKSDGEMVWNPEKIVVFRIPNPEVESVCEDVAKKIHVRVKDDNHIIVQLKDCDDFEQRHIDVAPLKSGQMGLC